MSRRPAHLCDCECDLAKAPGAKYAPGHEVLHRIKKLLQLAGPSNNRDEEARTAARRAVTMILEHKIVLQLPADGRAATTMPPPPTSRSGEAFDEIWRRAQARQAEVDAAAAREQAERAAWEERIRRREEEQKRNRQREEQERRYRDIRNDDPFAWNGGVRPPWWYEDPPPMGDPQPPPPVDPFVDALNGEMARKMREHLERERAREQRAQAAAAREQSDPDYDGPDPKEFSGGELEWRKRRHKAWKAAGRPMREAVNETTGEIVSIPDFRGLSW